MRPPQPAAMHAPSLHAWPAAQLRPHDPQLLAELSADSQPSAALALQSAKPALQAMVHPEPTQRPAALGASRQVETVDAVPAALHTLSVVDETQVAACGVHTAVATQLPPAQDCPAPQVTSVCPRPSALHTRRAVVEVQAASPGVHTHGAQAPARQVVRAPQAVIA